MTVSLGKNGWAAELNYPRVNGEEQLYSSKSHTTWDVIILIQSAWPGLSFKKEVRILRQCGMCFASKADLKLICATEEWGRAHWGSSLLSRSFKESEMKSDPFERIESEIRPIENTNCFCFISSLASSPFYDVFVQVTQIFSESITYCQSVHIIHSSSWYIIMGPITMTLWQILPIWPIWSPWPPWLLLTALTPLIILTDEDN